MRRFLRYAFVLIVFIIVFPLGLLVLLSLLQRRRDEYTTAMMGGMLAPSSQSAQPKAIEIPADILAQDAHEAEIPYLKPEAAITAGQVSANVTPSSPDDLRRIEGIGPKVSNVLQRSGISSFSQLAATDTSRLREILEAEKLSFINPETWPDQATLAARADWDQLKALQAELKAGRRS